MKTVAFLHEDSVHHCEMACSTLEGCKAYALQNEQLQAYEVEPRQNIAQQLYENVTGYEEGFSEQLLRFFRTEPTGCGFTKQGLTVEGQRVATA